MKKIFFASVALCCSLATVILLFGSSSQKNVDPENEWLAVNFYGILEDTEHNKNKVENISISGDYRNIIFYIKPLLATKDPLANYEKINLQDIAEIRLAQAAADSLYTFKHRDYMEVTVVFRISENALNPVVNEKKYIIERNKKISCYRMENGRPVLKQVRIDSLKSLKIEGYKEQKEGAFGPIEQQECRREISEK